VLRGETTGSDRRPHYVGFVAGALGLGVGVGIVGRLQGGAGFLFGAACFAAFTAAILQQTLP